MNGPGTEGTSLRQGFMQATPVSRAEATRTPWSPDRLIWLVLSVFWIGYAATFDFFAPEERVTYFLLSVGATIACAIFIFDIVAVIVGGFGLGLGIIYSLIARWEA